MVECTAALMLTPIAWLAATAASMPSAGVWSEQERARVEVRTTGDGGWAGQWDHVCVRARCAAGGAQGRAVQPVSPAEAASHSCRPT